LYLVDIPYRLGTGVGIHVGGAEGVGIGTAEGSTDGTGHEVRLEVVGALRMRIVESWPITV